MLVSMKIGVSLLFLVWLCVFSMCSLIGWVLLVLRLIGGIVM